MELDQSQSHVFVQHCCACYTLVYVLLKNSHAFGSMVGSYSKEQHSPCFLRAMLIPAKKNRIEGENLPK
jgi:hypothetical protein